MEILINDERKVTPKSVIIGVCGEIASRNLMIKAPEINNAALYVMRFAIPSGVVYETEINDESVTIPAAVLAEAGCGKMQWVARSTTGQLIAKSEIICYAVMQSVGDETNSLPAPEDTQSAIERINQAAKDAIESISGLTPEGGSIQEVVDARHSDYSDYTYKNLNQRLNAEFGTCVRTGTFEQRMTSLMQKVNEQTHANKETLDKIGEQNVSNWDEAYDLSHSHANETILDSITAVDTIPNVASSNPVSSSIMAQTVGIKKNLLPSQPAGTKIKNNQITYLFNDDGSVTVNGTTPDSGSTCTIYEGEPPFCVVGKYILSGCPYNSETTNGSYNIGIGEGTSTESYGFSIFDYGEATEFSLHETTKYIRVRIYIPSNTTVENLRFYPMIHDVNIIDNTYVPYVPNLQTQVADISARLQSTVGSSYKKNLLPYPVSITKGGVTFTCDENGYMSCSTPTDDKRGLSVGNAQYSLFLRAGTYVLSFVSDKVCTSEYGYIWVMKANNTIVAVKPLLNNESGSVEFTLESDQTVYVFSKMFDGKVAAMIRYASITDGTYEPYTPSIQEQIDALRVAVEALGGAVTTVNSEEV